jgi:hypothetical protein
MWQGIFYGHFSLEQQVFLVRMAQFFGFGFECGGSRVSLHA